LLGSIDWSGAAAFTRRIEASKLPAAILSNRVAIANSDSYPAHRWTPVLEPTTQVFGEGQYQQSEIVIQKLLAKNGVSGTIHKPVSVDTSGPEAAADWERIAVRRKLCGIRAHRELCLARREKLDKRHEYGTTDVSVNSTTRPICRSAI
jgi:hypothetical protein